ncbi:hypothetical protein COO91_08381 [Nostoc flagelliforme CCNUN1]|uniref:Uncharacterized protein n=1 Tax=Nostoc flagelliforme CCNUN1 TaxID=2038116 RepID=A0A2K8T3J4_9NOSO|nr:hypothetical protein COO91_08381 [Nostoc flagelliforme CCNUN1]
MTPEEKERLQAAVKEIAAILYKNTSPSELKTLEGIEKTVRCLRRATPTQMLEYVSPEIAFFLSNKLQAQIKDDPDKSKVV